MANNQNQTAAATDQEKEQLLKQIEQLQKAAAESEERAVAAEKESAAAKETLAALQSAAEKSAEETAPAEERVEVFVPKGYANDEPNLFIAVNGVSYLLPKGKKSLVPKHIAQEYERSVKAQQIQDKNVDNLKSKE